MFSTTKYYHFSDRSETVSEGISVHKNSKVIFIIDKKLTDDGIGTMLENLLEKGLGLETNEYQILTIAKKSIAIGNMIKSDDQKLVISFGISFNQLGFKTETAPYFLYDLSGTHLLLVDPVDKINTEKSQKAKLWNAIKHLKESF